VLFSSDYTVNKIKKIIPAVFFATVGKNPHIKINRNMKRIAPQINSGMWDFRLRLVSRALPTDERLREAKLITNPKLCYLCGIGLDDTKQGETKGLHRQGKDSRI
jgi:hypothetical protein